MDSLEISYLFKLPDGQSERFDVVLDAQTLALQADQSAQEADWTRLEFHQCDHCPLNRDELAHCPVALSLAGVTERLGNICSHDDIELTVITKERTVTGQTSAQRGISSLIGLLIATSGCPHTDFMKPMARFHLPLSTEEDTMFRAVGMYLIAQYFLRKEGNREDISLQGLTDIYKNLHTLNRSIAERIRFSAPADAPVNGLIVLDMYANLMPYLIEDHLDEIRYLFQPYLRENK